LIDTYLSVKYVHLQVCEMAKSVMAKSVAVERLFAAGNW